MHASADWSASLAARVRACTERDISLLRTRITRDDSPELSLGNPNFRNVSVICGRNHERDIYNEVGAQRFASERGVPLYSFYSADKWKSVDKSDSVRDMQRQYTRTIDPLRSSDTLVSAMRSYLWSLPPRSTKNLQGTLRLCRGMPVQLKHNEATELCATNGAEGTVIGWDSEEFMNGMHRLKTLFVELKNPPKELNMLDLPLNVVPVVPMTEQVLVEIAENAPINISRTQVPILPNFAMTDYGSQGRTRPFNVVDLRSCLSHLSIYTALSRSSSLSGTLLLSDFDDNKITGGLSGDLLAEFRQLEILAAATQEAFNSNNDASLALLDKGYVLFDVFQDLDEVFEIVVSERPLIKCHGHLHASQGSCVHQLIVNNHVSGTRNRREDGLVRSPS